MRQNPYHAAMLLTDFDAILFDMDGTLYREHHALPGAAETIARLQREGKPFGCVTNNSANTSEELAARLAKMDVALPPEAIYTSCHAMADWAMSHFKRPRIFNFAGRALRTMLAGRAEWVEGEQGGCDIVAVGTHFRENAVAFDFEAALAGLNHLCRGGHLLVGSADRVFPVQGGGVEFGSGSWGALYTYGANLPRERAHHVGKPSPEFFTPLLRKLGVEAKRCLIVGDNLESDILGGQQAGMATALVMTGITTPATLAASAIKPDAVFAGLPALM
ncbi:MAG: HAD-IIA family hydrolase, partial [Planctomycetota bacterium]|nr:HAD-IIA family hydrolase [Planctomycetota bacterium]